MQDTLDTLTAMRMQEARGYVTLDWTKMESANRPLHLEPVDLDCRNQMAAWCYQVVDVCKLSHESVEITMNLLDRFLCTPQGAAGRVDRWAFQLACMAALYTAVKIHEPQAMTPDLIARLSNGAYTRDDIERMERRLLTALQWRVNPPTCKQFAAIMIHDLLPSHVVDNAMKDVVMDLTVLQSELAVAHSLCVGAPASSVAYAALMNALESLGLDETVLSKLGTFLAQSLQIQCQAVENIQNVLYQILARQQRATCPPAGVPRPRRMSLKAETSVEGSPRAIVYSQC